MDLNQPLRQNLRDWILKHGKISSGELTDQTRLIEKGVINSFQVMEMILFLEELKGKPVEVEKLKGGEFDNLESMYAAFL